MAEPEGGLRDRLIFESFHRYVEGKLAAIGYFAPLGTPAQRIPPIHWAVAKVPAGSPARPKVLIEGQPIPENTLYVATGPTQHADAEIGSNMSDSQIQVTFDWYPVNEGIGKDVAGDLVAILRGQRYSVGADEPAFDVFGQDGLTVLFGCDIEDVQTEDAHDPRDAAARYQQQISCTIVDARP